MAQMLPPLESLDDFMARLAHRYMGKEEEIKQIIAESRKTAEQHAASPKTLLDGPGPATKEEKGANGSHPTNIGRSSDYLTARIARDRPDGEAANGNPPAEVDRLVMLLMERAGLHIPRPDDDG